MAARPKGPIETVNRSHGELVSITFFQADRLPAPLAEEAKKQGFELKPGLIAVRTLVSSPPHYSFERVDPSPAKVKEFYARLAEEDGESLDDLANRLTAD